MLVLRFLLDLVVWI